VYLYFEQKDLSSPLLLLFLPVMEKIDFPKAEETVLERWKEIRAFERQVELSKNRKRYTFYDGPPFAT